MNQCPVLASNAPSRQTPSRQTLAPQVIVREALEATAWTGGYERLGMARAAEAGLPLAVAIPGQMRNVAKAAGWLAKTDRLNAAMAQGWRRCSPSSLDSVDVACDDWLGSDAACLPPCYGGLRSVPDTNLGSSIRRCRRRS